MNRRAFVTGLGAVLAGLRAARAQPAGRVYRVGVMGVTPMPLLLGAWRQGLRDHGWIEGQNIVLEYRYSLGREELFPGFAAEFVRLNVDVIVAVSDAAIQAARKAASTIPIVMLAETDPVAAGFVASLARPGGHITGMPIFADELASKQLDLLKQLLPQCARVSVLTGLIASGPRSWSSARTAAGRLGLTLEQLAVGNAEEFHAAMTTIARQRPDALQVLPNSTVYTYLSQLIDFAASQRLPTIYSLREAVDVGGLLAYTTMLPELIHRVAGYVDKILNGAAPADLPVEQPTKFELVINLKTAQALGLTIPMSVLLRPDHVMEYMLDR